MNDLAALVAGFDRTLRAHGVAAGARRAQAFAAVLRALPPQSAAGLYWRARVAMLPAIDDAAAFDAAFTAYFTGRAAPEKDAPALLPPRSPAPAAPPRKTAAPEPSDQPAGESDAAEAPVRWLTASPDERLMERAFDAFGDDERALMLRLIASARVAQEFRPSRRRRAGRRGDRFDLRATLRAAPRTAGEFVRPRTTRPRERVRPLVFLVDVSGSMEPFARALIAYAQVAANARPAVRAFAFATRLHDLTLLLRRTPAPALSRAIAAAVPDYGGGTRIGASLHAFNERYAQRGTARGGTVVILSDGWERDDPELVGTEMKRLRRLCRRIVWINPQKRHPAYEPLARGMAAALPYLDDLVSGHSARSLDAVAALISSARTSAVSATPRRSAPSNRAVRGAV